MRKKRNNEKGRIEKKKERIKSNWKEEQYKEDRTVKKDGEMRSEERKIKKK